MFRYDDMPEISWIMYRPDLYNLETGKKAKKVAVVCN